MSIAHAKWREKILAQPDAILLVEELQRLLEAEKCGRQEYPCPGRYES